MYTSDPPSIPDSFSTPEALRLLSFFVCTALSAAAITSPTSSISSSSSSMASNSSKLTITIDTSTNIIGHGNTIQLPSPAVTDDRVRSVVELAVSRLAGVDEEGDGDDYAAPGLGDVEVKVNAGVNICGSKNVVLLGGGGVTASPRQSGGGEGERQGQGQGVKRKAEGDLVETPEAKKTAAGYLPTP